MLRSTKRLQEDILTRLKICRKFSVSKTDITASKLSVFPDVFTVEKKEQDKEKINADVKKVLIDALSDLADARAREGERLKKFFDESIEKMADLVRRIETRSPETITEFAERIKQRVEDFTNGVTLDDQDFSPRFVFTPTKLT